MNDGKLKKIVGETNQGYLSSALKTLDEISLSGVTLVDDLHTTRAELDAILLEIQQLAKDNSPGVGRIVQNLETTVEDLSGRLTEIGFNLDESARNLNEFARAIRMKPNRLLFSPDADVVEDTP